MFRTILSRASRSVTTTTAAAAAAAVAPVTRAALPCNLGVRGFSASAFRLEQARVQHPAPQWSSSAVADGQISRINLADYKGKFVVMVFYPMDFTFVCPTELLAFSDRVDEFRKLGAEVIGISCDSEFSHLAWNNLPRKSGGLGKLQIPLVADKTKSIAKDYGVLIENLGVALRGLFIIDDKGVIRVSQVNDLPIGRNVDETLRLIEAIQFTDKHGEVCPANWKKGGATIKPDPIKSLEYFEKSDNQ